MKISYKNHIRTEDGVTLVFDGAEPVQILRTDNDFQDVCDALDDERYDKLPGLLSLDKIEGKTEAKYGIKFKTGRVLLDGVEVPEVIGERIRSFHDSKLDYKPLVNFWEKLKTNPSLNSRQNLYRFLEKNHVTILPDGDFLAYRSVTSDYLDYHTRTMKSTPGSTLSMPRHEVTDDPQNACGPGLHVSAYSYAKKFNGGKTLVLVKVDPYNVVSVPKDSESEKIRVCKFYVLSDYRAGAPIAASVILSSKSKKEARKAKKSEAKKAEPSKGAKMELTRNSRGYVRIPTQVLQALRTKESLVIGVPREGSPRIIVAATADDLPKKIKLTKEIAITKKGAFVPPVALEESGLGKTRTLVGELYGNDTKFSIKI